jgi:hypothetical protein
MMAMLFRCLLLLQYPQFMQLLNLMRVSYVFLVLGKLGYDEVFSSFVELSFSSHLKCHQQATH